MDARLAAIRAALKYYFQVFLETGTVIAEMKWRPELPLVAVWMLYDTKHYLFVYESVA